MNYKHHCYYKLRFIPSTGQNFNQLEQAVQYIRQSETVREINDPFLVKFKGHFLWQFPLWFEDDGVNLTVFIELFCPVQELVFKPIMSNTFLPQIKAFNNF